MKVPGRSLGKPQWCGCALPGTESLKQVLQLSPLRTLCIPTDQFCKGERVFPLPYNGLQERDGFHVSRSFATGAVCAEETLDSSGSFCASRCLLHPSVGNVCPTHVEVFAEVKLGGGGGGMGMSTQKNLAPPPQNRNSFLVILWLPFKNT